MTEPWDPFDNAFDQAMLAVSLIPDSQYSAALEEWSKRDQQDDHAWAMRQVLTDLIKQTPIAAA